MNTAPIPSPMTRSSLWRILLAQAQVVFNDNAAKLALVGVIQVLLAATPSRASVWVSVVAALLVLPFILFSPVCGWLADRFSKRNIMMKLLSFQIGVMALMIGSLVLQNLYLAVACFFLLALQSTAFSPAKQGILKEIVGSKGLSMAVGWMELLTMCAILLGSFAGGWAFDRFLSQNPSAEPWNAAVMVVVILAVLCVVAALIFRPVMRTPAQMVEPFRAGLFVSHFQALGHLWRLKPLRLAALGVAYIYSLGGVFYLVILQAGREAFTSGIGATSQSGLNLLMLGVGVAIGAICAAGWGKRRFEPGIIAIGGLTMPFFLFLLGLIPATTGAFNAVLFFMGVSTGIFIVPLNVFLQDNAAEEERGRILAAANLMTNLGGICAVGIYLVFSNVLGLSSGVQFLILVLPTVLVALYVLQLLPESILRVAATAVLALFYRVTTRGEERVPKTGGVLLVCNHVSYVDAIILQLGCPRVVRFIAYEDFFKIPVLGFFLRLFKTIPISTRHAKDAIRIAAERLQQGEAVCIFPEGELTRTGKMHGFRKGFELIARKAGAPVVPVHLDSLWGSIFSFKGGRYFAKMPMRIPWLVTVSFGEPIPAEQADTDRVRREIMDLGEAAFTSRPELGSHIGFAALNCLKRKPFETIIVDRTMERREINRSKLLAASLTLAGWLRAHCPEKRIGIVLPPGIGGSVANLAV
ncbi:MFS transporter, partial [Kamptonema cortianum]|nr:MFS transporter [Kamptonema cortianum]